MPDPANPQSLNRYSYVQNNPLRYIDPTGHLEDDQIKEYTDYDTDEELAKLIANNYELYQLLCAMHLWDLFIGCKDGEKVVSGNFDLNELGRLRMGGLTLEQLVEKGLTGGTLLRFLGNNSIYLAHQWGDGGWIPDNYPSTKQFEYTYVVSPEDAGLWRLSDWGGGQAVETFLGWIKEWLAPIAGADGALKDGVFGPPPGHAKDDVVMKAYYVVDQNPTTGASLPLREIWVETQVVRGNAVISREWEVVYYHQ